MTDAKFPQQEAFPRIPCAHPPSAIFKVSWIRDLLQTRMTC